MKTYILIIIGVSLVTFCFVGCKDFLDAKPVNTLAQPNSLKDLRALLDREEEINQVYPAALQLCTDEFLTTTKGLGSISTIFQDMYLWKDNLDDPGGWRIPYKAVSIANVVLEGLERITDGKSTQGNFLKGEALFLRGWMFFTLAQLYCKHYDMSDAGNDLGLVIRLDSDSKINSARSTLKETYDQLLEDLTNAVDLLPEQSQYITRPFKSVAQAALARVYLSMGNYEMAEKMADAVLSKNNTLLDFNTLNANATFPITLENNTELLYYGVSSSTGVFIANAETHVNPEVLKLYESGDLRNKVFFETAGVWKRFKGFYNGRNGDVTAVIALDEVYLIKAECAARRNDLEQGLVHLNHLRKNRYSLNTPYELSAVNAKELLINVVQERRRQLIGRGLRWFDLRRLNIYPEFAQTLRRSIVQNGVLVDDTLEPNDLRYVRLIPRLAIDVGGYIQNPR